MRIFAPLFAFQAVGGSVSVEFAVWYVRAPQKECSVVGVQWGELVRGQVQRMDCPVHQWVLLQKEIKNVVKILECEWQK